MKQGIVTSVPNMMDSENPGGGGPVVPPMGGLFGGGPGGLGAASQLSPYLNVDPSYLGGAAPEFIANQDQSRGRMEKSFTAIGSSVLVGGAAGGVAGLYDGVRRTADMTGRLRRTQVMNYTLKSGASASNALGSIAVIYSSIYSLLSLAREEDDELKSVVGFPNCNFSEYAESL